MDITKNIVEHIGGVHAADSVGEELKRRKASAVKRSVARWALTIKRCAQFFKLCESHALFLKL